MTKINTSELIDSALDWAVAKCERLKGNVIEAVLVGELSPSTQWHWGGPIIERESISIGDQTHIYGQPKHSAWYATNRKGAHGLAPTPLITAMRCYVASKLGDEVEIPEELTK